ncbi:MAG: hypothetical protein K0Q79_400 [Flavipsychrobacter sp.]|jgi:uncharacterized repeat protein (TIGR01451 family)|nr:hypothetical protein [Flavipsychrobacter sp.]
MKNLHVSLCVVLSTLVILLSPNANAQDRIIDVSRTDTACGDSVHYYITTNPAIPLCSINVLTHYGDGQSELVHMNWSCIDAMTAHLYQSPGNYTTFCRIDSSGTAIDSFRKTFEILSFCNVLPIRFFYDENGDGAFNTASERYLTSPVKVEVGKNGVPIDTLSCTSGSYYICPASVAGDIFSFRVITAPPNQVLTSPSAGIVYDTIGTYTNGYPVRYFGLRCSGASTFDLSVSAVSMARTNAFVADIAAENISCVPQSGTLTMHFSPKYHYDPLNIIPMPASVIGNTIAWNLSSLKNNDPVRMWVRLGGGLPTGDTVHVDYAITPTAGDADPVNNAIIRVYTVTGGFDPNDIAVSPQGAIANGTKLEYTIRFENTGNDTAFNIHVLDTLSDKLDAGSLEIVSASHVMNVATFNKGGSNIVKFDFPNINLLDSSHHGLCNGSIRYTINAKTGFANGTKIYNRAGIYFDYNPVVVTNTVENTIGFQNAIPQINSQGSFKTYPNPAIDELTIETGSSTNCSISIANLVGQVLITQQLAGAKATIDVRPLPAGIYFLTVKSDNGVKTQKFEKL